MIYPSAFNKNLKESRIISEKGANSDNEEESIELLLKSEQNLSKPNSTCKISKYEEKGLECLIRLKPDIMESIK